MRWNKLITLWITHNSPELPVFVLFLLKKKKSETDKLLLCLNYFLIEVIHSTQLNLILTEAPRFS